ncbi:hypothetical protein GGX14DRAFT_468959, partial [Mycena pura]
MLHWRPISCALDKRLLTHSSRQLWSPQVIHRAQSTEAALGLRSHRPPDTRPDPKTPFGISDQEWEIRTGRAIYVLQQTLPEFFSTGLVNSVDRFTGSAHEPSASYIPVASVNPFDYHVPPDEDVESIYSPNVRLSYTPPVALPPPFPKTLHIEGMPMYLASSVFVRHTLNALYADLKVTLNKVALDAHGEPRKNREKSLFVGLTASGIARVSGAVGEWEVNSTYTFSPLTGLIHVHTINSIHPAPHQAVYDALRARLGIAFGIKEPSQPGGAASAVKDLG